MSMSTAMRLLALAFSSLVFVSNGARVRLHRPPTGKGRYTGWAKGKSAFICLEKWKKTMGGKGTKQFCLVDLQQILAPKEGSKSKLMASNRWSKCQAEKRPYAMKLCNFKGKKDKRVSYANRLHLPKSCLSIVPRPFQEKLTVFEAAVTADECNKMIKTKYAGRGKFFTPPKPADNAKARIVPVTFTKRPFDLSLQLTDDKKHVELALVDGKEAKCAGIAPHMIIVNSEGEELVGDVPGTGRWTEAGIKKMAEKFRQIPLPATLYFQGVPNEAPDDCFTEPSDSSADMTEDITQDGENLAQDNEDGNVEAEDEIVEAPDKKVSDNEDQDEEADVLDEELGDSDTEDEDVDVPDEELVDAEKTENVDVPDETISDTEENDDDTDVPVESDTDEEDSKEEEALPETDAAPQDEQSMEGNELEAEFGETEALDNEDAVEEIDTEEELQPNSQEAATFELTLSGWEMLDFWRKKEADEIASKMNARF